MLNHRRLLHIAINKHLDFQVGMHVPGSQGNRLFNAIWATPTSWLDNWHGTPLTTVWTISTLCFLDEMIVSSVLILSIMESSVMKVPVLPTSALQWTWRMSILCVFLTRLMEVDRGDGTPWSGHARNSETASPEMEAYLARHSDKEKMVSQSCIYLHVILVNIIMLETVIFLSEWEHVMSCHVMSCHVMSCHVMSCHVMSCHDTSRHLMSCHVTELVSYHVNGP